MKSELRDHVYNRSVLGSGFDGLVVYKNPFAMKWIYQENYSVPDILYPNSGQSMISWITLSWITWLSFSK